jgi:hypothetical protein
MIRSVLVLLFLAFVISACSDSPASIDAKIAGLEAQIDSLAQAEDLDVDKVKPLLVELNILQWRKMQRNPFWKDQPYDEIFNALADNYMIINFEEYTPESTHLYRKIIDVWPNYGSQNNTDPVTWNMQDVNIIKTTISGVLGFDPDPGDYADFSWTASMFDIELAELNSGKVLIKILLK